MFRKLCFCTYKAFAVVFRKLYFRVHKTTLAKVIRKLCFCVHERLNFAPIGEQEGTPQSCVFSLLSLVTR